MQPAMIFAARMKRVMSPSLCFVAMVSLNALACGHTNESARETTVTAANAPAPHTEGTVVSPRPDDAPAASSMVDAQDAQASPPKQANAQAPQMLKTAPVVSGKTGPATLPAPTPPSIAPPNAESRDPVVQGETAPEIKITATIRRSVVESKALGFNAKNVKIITVGTRVTLRGVVDTQRERDIIEAHAKQAPGVSAVDNQIELTK